jgi:hypothetical protein
MQIFLDRKIGDLSPEGDPLKSMPRRRLKQTQTVNRRFISPKMLAQAQNNEKWGLCIEVGKLQSLTPLCRRTFGLRKTLNLWACRPTNLTGCIFKVFNEKFHDPKTAFQNLHHTHHTPAPLSVTTVSTATTVTTVTTVTSTTPSFHPQKSN